GQAYLYWGNPGLWYVKLNEDMISYDQSIGDKGIVSIEMTPESFGSQQGRDGEKRASYTEGPWFYKRNNLYYMIYAAKGIPEYIAYSTAPSAEGPWTYRGIIMERADHLAFTNHAGIIDYEGNSYFFYHDQALSEGEGFKRSVSVEQFSYNDDGTIPLIEPTKTGVKESVSNVNPYKKVEAETIAWSEGLKTSGNSQSGVYLNQINNGDYLIVRSVDFGKGAKTFEACVASASKGAQIEVRLGNRNGELLGKLEIENTGGWEKWSKVKGKLKKATGVHDICLVFKGDDGELFNFDWWVLK
ncbi:MAG: carbohydrate-binding protein, partial [Prolixibacteraceae bacterium]|nr:carbohydrate-binding protein [Prolixibacteraceae bacterium]